MIRKLVWSVNRAIAFLDKRKIKVPESHKGVCQYDYWDCSQILSAENQGGEFTFEVSYGRFRVFANLLDPESLAIAESIARSRPRYWF